MTTQHADGAETDSTVAVLRRLRSSSVARAPLLVTLELAHPAQGLFQALRDRHFPAARAMVPAHVSLFHALPGGAREPIMQRLRGLAGPRPAIGIEAPVLLGHGVGFPLRAPGLLALRADLARDWAAWLIPQDRQPFQPHLTVQNKVTPEEARRTLERLRRGFVPFRTEGAALRLWRYLDGPWEALETFALAREAIS